ncbi:MAG: DUF5011 domain-containing protein [Mariprofundaceae bacterium]
MKFSNVTHKFLLGLASAAMILCFSSAAHAFGFISTAFNSAYPSATNLTSLSSSCTLCHASASGGAFNSYGSALKGTAGKMDFAAIEGSDSDNDGFSNIDEINAAGGGTHPGKASDKPTVVDTVAPAIILNGSATVSLNIGDSYADAGATASDDVDGDITANIAVGGDSVDTTIAGTYMVTYNVSDAAGNSASEVTRIVTVIPDTPDAAAPTIETLGVSPITMLVDGVYNDAGAIASDDRDGDITASIVDTASSVDTSAAGTYTVTYNVSDAAGNPAAEQTRIVTVGDTEIDGDGDGVADAVEGAEASNASVASGLVTDGGSILVISSDGGSLGVSSSPSVDGGPADVDTGFGVITYRVNVLFPENPVKVTIKSSTALPSNLKLYSVDGSGTHTAVSSANFKVIDGNTVEITCSDGGMNDQDGDPANGIILAAFAFAQGEAPAISSSGGCLMPAGNMLWMIPMGLIMLIGAGLMRRRA